MRNELGDSAQKTLKEFSQAQIDRMSNLNDWVSRHTALNPNHDFVQIRRHILEDFMKVHRDAVELVIEEHPALDLYVKARKSSGFWFVVAVIAIVAYLLKT